MFATVSPQGLPSVTQFVGQSVPGILSAAPPLTTAGNTRNNIQVSQNKLRPVGKTHHQQKKSDIHPLLQRVTASLGIDDKARMSPQEFIDADLNLGTAQPLTDEDILETVTVADESSS